MILPVGADAKYLTIKVCREGTFHAKNTSPFIKAIPANTLTPSFCSFHHLFIWTNKKQ